MNQGKAIVQISTGGYRGHKAGHVMICRRLDGLLERLEVGKAIIGWSCDRELYGRVLDFLKPRGVECYLWLPVFSETGILKEGLGRLVGDTGAAPQSYRLADGEEFEFYCPNQRRNLDAFLEVYHEHFDGLGFDGVFLDKIRYGSFANGLDGVFGCFCPACMERYREHGIDVDELKGQMGLVRRGAAGYGGRALGIRSYGRGRYRFEEPVWEPFFQKKAVDITRALEVLTSFFHGRGMKVGIDTFAPYLAYFVGQDLERLAPMADFIKPMMYRITNAPAGMPFETDCLIRETVRPAGSMAGQDIAHPAAMSPDGRSGSAALVQARERLFRSLGCRDMGKGAFDLGFTARELEYAAGLGTPVYCGIEVNRNEVAPSTPGYIGETMEGLREVGIEGYVLSWDLMSATDENLAAVEQHLYRR